MSNTLSILECQLSPPRLALSSTPHSFCYGGAFLSQSTFEKKHARHLRIAQQSAPPRGSCSNQTKGAQFVAAKKPPLASLQFEANDLIYTGTEKTSHKLHGLIEPVSGIRYGNGKNQTKNKSQINNFTRTRWLQASLRLTVVPDLYIYRHQHQQHVLIGTNI